jgi:hypothetical protein
MLLHPHMSASYFLLGAVGEKERQGKQLCERKCVKERQGCVKERQKASNCQSFCVCVQAGKSKRTWATFGECGGRGGIEQHICGQSEQWLEGESLGGCANGWWPFQVRPLPLPPASFLLPPSYSPFLSPTLNRSLALYFSHKHKHKHTQMQDGGISGIWLGGNPLKAKAGGGWSGAGGQTATRIANFSLYGGYISDAGTYLRYFF